MSRGCAKPLHLTTLLSPHPVPCPGCAPALFSVLFLLLNGSRFWHEAPLLGHRPDVFTLSVLSVTVTLPLKNVRKRRFRKTAKKKVSCFSHRCTCNNQGIGRQRHYRCSCLLVQKACNFLTLPHMFPWLRLERREGSRCKDFFGCFLHGASMFSKIFCGEDPLQKTAGLHSCRCLAIVHFFLLTEKKGRLTSK